MRLVIKLFPEIMVKSRTLRRNLTRILASNIRNLTRDLNTRVAIKDLWDQLDIRITPDADLQTFLQRLANTPGIDLIEFIERKPFTTLDELIPDLVHLNSDRIQGKSFRMKVKRRGKHTFTSVEAEQFLGGALFDSQPDTRVSLRNPEVVVGVNLVDNHADFVSDIWQGIGGFPMGSQGEVLSLISGGFDSGVATYLSMKRGFKTHFIFFNLGGINHEIGVKQVADYLWRRYSYSHRVKFITIPFEPVVEEILTKVHHSHMGVVLKRLMIRAANQCAEILKSKALVTGESLAQVSSQTLSNLNLIDDVSDRLVIRPLIVMDKQDIITLSRAIGTEPFALSMPEYCAVISDRPTSSASGKRIKAEEAEFNIEVLNQAVENARVELIDEVLSAVDTPFDTQEVKTPAKSDIIVDIRHPDDKKPLPFGHNAVLEIPFYKLHRKMSELDKSQRYLLFCDRGVMSHMQAAQLKSVGFDNILVLNP